jgi:hypothetical protein
VHWLNLAVRILHSPEYIGSEPIARATWLSLLLWCAEQENGGRVRGAMSWSDRQWQQTCGITVEELRSAGCLVIIDGDDVVVWGYPADKEAEVQAKREAGRIGGLRSGEARAKDRCVSASTNPRSTPSSSASTERKGIGKEEDGRVSATPSPSASVISDSEWLRTLRVNPAYRGLDVDREWAKATAWCQTNRKQLTRRRFINWLNRVDVPVDRTPPPSVQTIAEPQGWKSYLNHTYPDSRFAAGQQDEVSDWSKLPRDVQTKLAGEIRRDAAA